LWFPKPSETFVFREVVKLWDMGLDIKVFSLYGELIRQLSPEMLGVAPRVERLGRPYLSHFGPDLAYWFKKQPKLTLGLIKTVMLRPPKGLEKTGENIWALICAFRLARRFLEQDIEHIHAPWANGPATAAWLASRLTGIPFSFTARAWDIYPPDNLLPDKIRDAAFVRSETAHNIPFLRTVSGQVGDKFYLTYNGVPLQAKKEAPVPMKPPYRLLALGRFVGKKGYAYLLEACSLLQSQGLQFHLTLAGDGPEMGLLKRMTRQLGLENLVSFPGFVTHDQVPGLFQKADLFIMPSVIHSSGDRDGIPLVIMESLLHRVPVAATNVSGIPELIKDGLTGRLVPEKNPSALAAAMEDLLLNRSRALQLAENGRDLILRQFDPDTNYRLVRDLFVRYHALCPPGGPR
jgi:glycosyltransferase involved in cell wall biosynthesis